MYLVVLKWIANFKDDICVVAETREKAQEWIDKKMEGKQYNGAGYYSIEEVEKCS